MAVISSPSSKTKSPARNKNESKATKKRAQADDNGGEQSKPKHQKSPRFRVVGSRIYDSVNGRSCHQGRQKTIDFVASCKSKNGEKPCTLHFCHKCLLNRYGEVAKKVDLLDDWKCPKCRGICNCSCCMKKRGHKPTGIMVRAAKAIGFSSASEMILAKGLENLERRVSPRKQGKENSYDKDNDANLNTRNSKPISDGKREKKSKREGLKEISNANKEDGACSNLSSPKKPKVPEGASKKELKTDVEDGVVPLVKKKYKKKVSDETSRPSEKKAYENEMKTDVEDGSVPLEKKKSKKRISDEASRVSEKTSEKELKTDGKDVNVPLEKKKSKKRVSNETSMCPIKPYGKRRKDGEIHKDLGVSNALEDDNANANAKAAVKSREIKKCAMNLEQREVHVDLPLPQGTILTSVWGIDLSPKDMGLALQFFEFCTVFGKVIDVSRNQASSVLRELKRGSSGRRGRQGQYSSVVHIHIQLLSLIQEDKGDKSASITKESWLRALKKYVSESNYVSKEMLPASLNDDVNGYDGLDFSKKLRLLTFLCDEALGTTKLRSWIDEEYSKFVEREKESKEKIGAAKSKEKLLKQKLEDEVVKAIIARNGAPISISDHEALISQFKSDVAQVHAEMLEAQGVVSKRRPRLDAMRIEPYLLDAEGRVFWNLRCCGGNELLLQDMGTWDVNASAEKWTIYERKEDIEEYISSVR
ncbi:hypothetical protein L484_008665 [Morus notabilis]|uniref:DDT domain-containing protein n=2 Tax=Morus notabilis TaxID=981085 RepID=W9RUZ7_9ROSA|nr:hypothetical protein L484_008665 [Morus notabilis]